MQPEFSLTSDRSVVRPTPLGVESYCDWNARCAQAHAELYLTATSVLAEVVDFVTHQTKARVIYEANEPAGLIATNEEEMDRLTDFIDQAKAQEPKFHYQRHTIYMRFCPADSHNGASLADLSRLQTNPREPIFDSGAHHSVPYLPDGTYEP